MMQRLRDSLATVLDDLPGGPHRPQELARLLKLNKTLSSRIGKAVRTRDPLASCNVMPGPEGLRMVLKACAKKGASRESIDAAEGAIHAFDRLIRHDLGDRAALDAIVSDSLPHARKNFEMSNRRAMYKAVANLKGVTAKACLRTYLVHPSDDPVRHDYAMVLGLLGLRRLRPRAVVQVSNIHLARNGGNDARLTLDGQAVESVDGLLLKPYCSPALSRLVVRHVGASMQYVLEGEEMGLSSAVDVVIGEVNRAFFKRYRTAEGRRSTGAFTEVEQPMKTLVFDMLLHEDVWPGCTPELRIYDMVVRGPADANDPTRDIDRLETAESIEFLDHDVARFRAAEIPEYVDMLRLVCGKLGWDGKKFRGYRCRIRYPFYGSQVCMDFNPPLAPSRSD
ncbi:MAG: hypothetical protein ABIG44_17075 [Planctomycetota bacterium]